MSDNQQLSLKSVKRLNNGVEIPILGLGTWQSSGVELEKAIINAIEIGYRHIDTAAFYDNEEIIGETVKNLSLNREDLFITSKLWNTDHGYDKTITAFKRTLTKLQCEYLDLYLIHWPVSQIRKESWKALEFLYKEGLVRAIGVANYMAPHLEELLHDADIIPAVNQFEFHPYIDRWKAKKFCDDHNIVVEAYSPLTRAAKLMDPLLRDIGKSYQKSPAQILIRWGLQHGVISLPKSVNPTRLRENATVFDFNLSPEAFNRLNKIEERYRVTIFDPEGPDFR